MAQRHIGPPFATKFTEYPRRGGAWVVGKPDLLTGKVVLQMGAQPPTPGGDLFAGAGFENPVVINAPGTYVFAATVDIGPVTLQPRGHRIAAEVVFGLHGLGGDRREYTTPGIGVNYGTQSLVFPATLQSGTYTLGMAVGLLMNYSGTPNPLPYGEIIVTYRSVFQRLPPGIEESVEETETQSFRERGAETKRITRELTGAKAAEEEALTSE